MYFSELWNIAENHTELAEPPCIAVASAECGSSSGSSISRYSVWPWKCVLLLSLLSCFDSQQLLQYGSFELSILATLPQVNCCRYGPIPIPTTMPSQQLLHSGLYYWRTSAPLAYGPTFSASSHQQPNWRGTNWNLWTPHRLQQSSSKVTHRAKMTNKFLLQNELLQEMKQGAEWTIMVVRWLCRKIHTGYQTRF